MKLQRNLTLTTALLLLAPVGMSLIAIGCSDKQEREISVYDQANEDIEKQNFQSAILRMEDQLARQPDDQKAKVILASAYAAKGGISMRSYIDLAQEIMDSSEAKGSLYDERGRAVFEKLRSGANEGQKDFLDTLSEFNKALWQISDIIIKFEKIPKIETEEQYKDVKKAVSVLGKETHLSRGPAIYSGLLRLVLFRYHMDHYYRFPEVKDCQIDATELYRKISQLREEVGLVFQSFKQGIANEKRAEKVGEFATKVDQSFDKALLKLAKYAKNDAPADLSLFLMPFGVECGEEE